MAYAEVWSDDQGRRVGGNRCDKVRLDVAFGGAGELFGADNDAHGIAELVTRLRRVAPELIVLEASGGLETGLVGKLGAAQLPVALVNPCQVRATSHAPSGSWPRPTHSMPKCCLCLPSGCKRHCARCRMSRLVIYRR